MIGPRRTFGLFVFLAALSNPALAVQTEGMQDQFTLARELLARGRRDEALAALRKLDAMSPDQAAAYALWTANDYSAWRDFLVEGGEFELIAKRLIEAARLERMARRNDPEAILAKVRTATQSDDALERRAAVRALAAEHGEYAAPQLIALIAEPLPEERRLLAMHALAQMGEEVVVPLGVTLGSEDVMQRKNAANVLGTIASPRGKGALQRAAGADADEGVRSAAADALKRMKAEGDAHDSFLQLAEGYWRRSDTALSRGESGEVVWGWKDKQLVGTPIPRELYASEMSKRASYDALSVDPASPQALAALARAFVDAQTRLDALTAAGTDVGTWKDALGATLIAVNGAGVPALDLALTSAVEAGDASTGGALCRVIGPLANEPTDGLASALASQDGSLRSEAAVALGGIASRSAGGASGSGGGGASEEVVGILGASAAREVLRLVVVIDADMERANAMADALRGRGAHVTVAGTGVAGMVLLRRSPGIDALVVADSLPDMTTGQVIDEVRGEPRFAELPLVVLSAKEDEAAALYGERTTGTSSGAADLDALEGALTAELEGDRALASDLAGRSAETLYELSRSGGNISGVLDQLAQAAMRPDETALPAMRALGQAGTGAQAGVLLGVLADEARSEGARATAGEALARIVARDGSAVGADGIAKLQEVARSQAALPVRESAARVLGNLPLPPAERAKLLQSLRG